MQLQTPVRLAFLVKRQCLACTRDTSYIQCHCSMCHLEFELSLSQLFFSWSYSFYSTTGSCPPPICYTHLCIHASATVAYPLQQESVSPLSLAMWTTIIHLYVYMFPVSVAINGGQDRAYFEAGKLKETGTVRAPYINFYIFN